MNIHLRDVLDSDLPIFFKHRNDPEASQMAAFPSRDRESFMTHWQRILKDDSNILKTILCDRQVAGNVVSFMMEGKREIGYWLGREFWGKGSPPKYWICFYNTSMLVPFMVLSLHTTLDPNEC